MGLQLGRLITGGGGRGVNWDFTVFCMNDDVMGKITYLFASPKFRLTLPKFRSC